MKFSISLVAMLTTLLAGAGLARPVSQTEAMTVAGSFVSAIYGENKAGSCWPYEDLKARPGVFVCERLLKDGSSVTLITGANTSMPPVLLYYRGRPLDITSADRTKKVAEDALGSDGVVQIASVYYSPLDFWFEYQAGEERVMVSPGNFRVYEPELVRDAEPIGYSDELSAEFEEHWRNYLSGQIPFELDGQYWIPGVSDWDWHYGCAPTAAANVLTYWDDNGYDLLVDSVRLLVPDPIEGDVDDVPNVTKQLAIEMNTDTLVTGGTKVDSVVPGILAVCNDPAWENNYSFNSYLVWDDPVLLISEINNDRPGVLGLLGHPYYHDHAVTYCGWGPPNEDWIMIHDEWDSTPIDTVIYYYYSGGPRGIIPVIPGGVTYPDVAVTSIAQPDIAIPPGVITPQAYVANYGNSTDPCSVFYRIERPGGGFYENFDDGVFPPVGWQVENPDGGLFEWIRGDAHPYTAPYYATCLREASLLANDDWLISPKVRVREKDTLYFWFRSLSTDMESIEVWVSYTDASPTSFIDVIQAFDFNNTSYLLGRASFHTIGDTMVHIGIRYGMRALLPYGTGICIDDIQLRTAYYAESTKVTVAPGNSELVSFFPWDAKEGHYVARCSVYQAGDVNPSNDVKTRDFLVTPTLIPPSDWTEMRPIPLGPSDKPVRRGGSLTYMEDNGLIYALKGYKTGDFYSYNPVSNIWATLLPVPTGPSGRLPRKGARLAADGNRYIYATKGNNTPEFWRYDTDSIAWRQMDDVPLGLSRKKVKGGTDMEHVFKAGFGYIYLLKGYKSEFYRFDIAADSWFVLPHAPPGAEAKWKKGSFIVYDQDNIIYAHRAKYYVGGYHQMWRYDIAGDTWHRDTLAGMPLLGMHGGRMRSKKSKDGGCAAWYNSEFYALKGGNTQQFFKYNPASSAWTELDTVPRYSPTTDRKRRVKYGADIVNIGNAFYALKGNKTRELWRYAVPAYGLPLTANRSGVMGRELSAVSRLLIAPNPLARGFATLYYALPRPGPVNISIYDVAGRSVECVRVTSCAAQGCHPMDLRSLSSGVYLVRLEANGFVATRKLVVQR